MLSDKKPYIESYLNPFIKYLSGVNPNILTLLGSIPPILFFVAIYTHQYILAVLFFLGNLFDFIDGMVARKYKKVTAFGGFLDSTFDRLADFLIITAFAFGGLVRWEIVAPILLFAFLTSYIRSKSESARKDVNFAVGLIERTERLLIIIVALILYMIFPTLTLNELNIIEAIFIILMFLSLYTVLQRIAYAYKKL